MVRSCSACKNRWRNDNCVSFHRFPANPVMKEQWVNALRRKGFVPTKHSFICSDHFTDTSFLRVEPKRVLRMDAVPSLFNFANNLPAKTTKPQKRKALIEKCAEESPAEILTITVSTYDGTKLRDSIKTAFAKIAPFAVDNKLNDFIETEEPSTSISTSNCDDTPLNTFIKTEPLETISASPCDDTFSDLIKVEPTTTDIPTSTYDDPTLSTFIKTEPLESISTFPTDDTNFSDLIKAEEPSTSISTSTFDGTTLSIIKTEPLESISTSPCDDTNLNDFIKIEEPFSNTSGAAYDDKKLTDFIKTEESSASTSTSDLDDTVLNDCIKRKKPSTSIATSAYDSTKLCRMIKRAFQKIVSSADGHTKSRTPIHQKTKREFYVGDFKEKDMESLRDAKLMWQAAKRQLGRKNNQLKNLRIRRDRLQMQLRTLKNLVKKMKKCNQSLTP